MDIVIGIIVGLFVLMFLVVVHEFGHFLAARRNGVHVLEFGIGFPPRAIAWVRKNGKWQRLPKTEWEKLRENPPEFKSLKPSEKPKLIEDGLVFSFNWLPIGGFCQMNGESANDSRSGTFGHASFWQKTKILFAGVAMNWLVAFVILTILAWTGIPDFLDNQFTIPADTRTVLAPVEISSVAEDSPAASAGLLPGDQILKVDGIEVWRGSEITDYNSTRASETVTYTISREDTPAFDVTVKLNPADSAYLLGVSMTTTPTRSYSTWSAPLVGAGLTLQMTGETYKGVGEMLWNLISGIGRQFSFDDAVRESGREAISTVGDSVSGPVGIIGTLFPAFTASGPTNLAFLAALISVSLACMNVLPIPALDGGRWFLIALFKVRKKKLTKATEEKIVARAFVALLALMFIVTILDIIRMF